MLNFSRGSIRLFRVAGVDVYLHWWWFLVAFYEIGSGNSRYSSVSWNIAEYLALFLIVLTHEFGHAMACRQVGGTANRILLWPLGGVAYVDPPQRPGAMLWSIAAGPLVNVVLAPILYGLLRGANSLGWRNDMPDAYLLIKSILFINLGLLIFNMLPIYPLDGGKILWSVLWFPLGRAKSLMVAVVVGMIGIVGVFVVSAISLSVWGGLVGVYMLISCWSAMQQARVMLRREKMPRRAGFACPSCKAAPPLGALWTCGKCQQAFDTFATGAACPNCGTQFPNTMCGDCNRQFPMDEWRVASAPNYGVMNGGVPVR